MNFVTRLLRRWGAAGAAENARCSLVELREVDRTADVLARHMAGARQTTADRRPSARRPADRRIA